MTIPPAQRDFLGYGDSPPSADWPGGARVAVSLVVNVEEGAELPDHLESALRVLAVMKEDDASDLAREFILPAVMKMREPFEKNDNPYGDVLAEVERFLRETYGEPIEWSAPTANTPYANAADGIAEDLLERGVVVHLRLEDEQARRRALLPGVAERRVEHVRDRLLAVAHGGDDRIGADHFHGLNGHGNAVIHT